MDAGKRRGQRTRSRLALVLLEALRITTWRSVRLAVQFVVHRAGRRPRIQERVGLVQPVLVFDRLPRREREFDRLALVAPLLGCDGWRAADSAGARCLERVDPFL